jgi:hypothetical protein
MPVIPASRRLRQEYHKWETSLGYRSRDCLGKEKKKNL